MKRDYYEILGLKKDAAAPDIKKAYRSMALKHHPDRVPVEQKKDAEEKFKEISEAYGVLSDPQKRQMYDQYGHSGIDQRYTAEDIFKGADFGNIFEEMGIGDILGQMFGGGGQDFFGGGSTRGGGRRARRGHDIQYEVEVTLEEAYTGVKKKVKLPRHDECEECKGSGAKPGTSMKTCPTCKGQGQVIMSSGFFRMAQTCSTCGGQGKVITEHCAKCQGAGVIRVTRNIDVNIPAGVDGDSRLRVKGEGEYGAGGRGDLYIYINLKQHPVFQRSGSELQMELPVSFVKAALGSDVSVPTLTGNVSMKIPAGTQSGKIFRLREKGMPDLHSGQHGDQYVRVMIQVPTNLSSEQRRILEEYARVSGDDIKDSDDSFAEKIKKVFK